MGWLLGIWSCTVWIFSYVHSYPKVHRIRLSLHGCSPLCCRFDDVLCHSPEIDEDWNLVLLVGCIIIHTTWATFEDLHKLRGFTTTLMYCGTFTSCLQRLMTFFEPLWVRFVLWFTLTPFAFYYFFGVVTECLLIVRMNFIIFHNEVSWNCIGSLRIS